jgi:hypothetical protein
MESVMRTFSVEEAKDFCEGMDPPIFFRSVDWQYPDPVPSYFLPKDSGAKIALSRTIASTFLEQGPSLLWITDTKTWPSSSHIDLFNGYRRSHGEMRTIEEAPLHSFETNGDLNAFISILCLGLFFVWDLEIISRDRAIAVTVSHDEWLEYRFAKGHENVIPIFEKCLNWLLATETQA